MAIQHGLLLTLTIVSSIALSGCSPNEPADIDQQTTQSAPFSQLQGEHAPSAVVGASEIPYPVYPNGSKYRVGGEHGLKIVLFETEDSFETVDDYYRNATSKSDMPRLVAMNDYVRYSNNSEDSDPWATSRPGIVIHQFNDDRERAAVGADYKARTNIIMSF